MAETTQAPTAPTTLAPGGGPLSPGVRRITLDAAGLPLSALLSEPADGSAPRATIVALHGGGMRAGYFDGQAHPDVSLLTLGARLGCAVLALDRPGYGASAPHLPAGQPLLDQAKTVRAALDDARGRYVGGPLFLLAHSFGAKLALALAAGAPRGLFLGLDVSGCGHRPAVDAARLLRRPDGTALRHLHWGPLHLYPPGTFLAGQQIVAPMPPRERDAAGAWEAFAPRLLPRVRVPVRFTFAEHEAWWRHTDADLAELTALLSAAPRVLVDRLPGAGHNISLGSAARAYHLRALAFLDECLGAADRSPAAP
ncbi:MULTISPECIES: alpha/beta hydrolase [Streptomyces]|uniref:Alpha/beta fold hydrolase n=1 Tax=Streptomyces solicathayae TaxID=3081768 RepID=A0ABZ0LP53_9ACTN|nr:alpha/beta fold hydrolase [Streptomyces sp. HUAS YS2]WOX21297.1 alpha/beta fold hydrolase [Streptomyces sp. HUAS YS2]